MLAFAWQWRDGARPQVNLASRLAASLCAGIGGHAGSVEVSGIHCAYRPLKSAAAAARAWRPALLPSGRVCTFHGYFDNAVAIATELGANASDLASLYGTAVDRWGDDADLKIIGEYCAVIADPDATTVRLSRSPLRAPPLCYFHSEELVAAASVPRALFAAGVERRLNEARVADTALINFTDREMSWFEGISRVPVDSIVLLQRSQERQLRRYYDLLASPTVRLKSDRDYIDRASALLDEAVRTSIRAFTKPGATLSGGLDSSQVAIRTLKALPQGRRLPTFTFHPEAGFDGRDDRAAIGNERPMVEAFLEMHPGLEPHFTANEGYGHDHRWSDFFHLMGGAPPGLTNMYVFHGLFAEASKAGCDVLLLAEWGNYTFSDKGDWGFVEYFLTGKWRQLWRALARLRHDGRSLPMRFLIRTLSGLLPRPLWRLAKRAYRRGDASVLDMMQPLSPGYRASSGADERLRNSGIDIDHYHPWSRKHAMQLLFASDDGEGAEIYQAFEQMYGVAQRDPTAYRPFVEFCFGLPVEMFIRDGTQRWLAKQLAKGIMPEDQRDNFLNGRWDADWHLRIGRRRAEYLAEFQRLAKDERLSNMLDVPRLRAALEDWPDKTPNDPQIYCPREFAVPRGLLAARFVNWAEGRND